MKKLIFILALLFSTVMFSQEVKKEKQGDLVKVTYYSIDGSIEQEGTFKNNKLHGKWVMYCKDNQFKTIGFYNNGKKDGLWLFKQDGKLKEVFYSDNKILSINVWNDLEKSLVVN